MIRKFVSSLFKRIADYFNAIFDEQSNILDKFYSGMQNGW